MDRPTLEAMQLAKLRAMLSEVLPRNPFQARKLGVSVPRLESMADLRALPLTTKQELVEDQRANPPYGTNLTYPLQRYVRLHQTSGTSQGRPLRWLDTAQSWQWLLDCWRQKYGLVDLRPADRLMFPFSFGPFIGFWGAFEGALRLGNMCLAAGGMTTQARLRFLLDNAATIVCCTPSYALRMAEVAREEGLDVKNSPVRGLIVAGEPGGSIAGTRERIEQAWGARVFDHTGMTEIGSLGMECADGPGGVHLLETECIGEVIDPNTGAVLAPGQEGELVLTNLGRLGSPLVRYRTGDRVIFDPNPCPCHRPFSRMLGGIRGRTDDMLVVRGNNVYPSALEDLLLSFPAVREFQLVVETRDGQSDVTIRLETDGMGEEFVRRVVNAVRDRLHFRPKIELVAPGSLPRFEMKARRLVRTMT